MTAPTSYERREVAARLRKTRGIMAFVDALGIDPDGDWCWTDVSRRVADLIDPTCHPVPSDGGFFTCSECRERIGAVLPALGTVLMHHCSHCGARVTSGGER